MSWNVISCSVLCWKAQVGFWLFCFGFYFFNSPHNNYLESILDCISCKIICLTKFTFHLQICSSFTYPLLFSEVFLIKSSSESFPNTVPMGRVQDWFKTTDFVSQERALHEKVLWLLNFRFSSNYNI